MRVLHLYSGNLYGGIESLLVTLARYRDVCPAMEPVFGLCFEGRLYDELLGSGVVVHPLGNVRISRPWTVWKARERLRDLLARERFDVVVCHSCWPHALFAGVVRAQKTPLVFWAHDIPTGRHWLERWAKWSAPDLVLANSRMTQAGLVNLFPRTRSEVLYLPVPAPTYPDRDLVREEVRHALGAEEGGVVIIQACRLERWKGHRLLLEALGILRGMPNWLCWIAGGAQRSPEQAYLEELRREVARLGIADRVLFLGQRADVAHLLAAADIHCQPNTGAEPFGIAFVEALYAGLPVVTTALGGALEIVEERCGVLVPPGDAEGLAAELARLLRDAELRQRLGGAGPTRARLLCDPSRQVGSLHRRFAELIRRAA